jgi:hypothetical protein
MGLVLAFPTPVDRIAALDRARLWAAPPELTPDEAIVLSKFRECSQDDRDAVLAWLVELHAKQAGKNRAAAKRAAKEALDHQDVNWIRSTYQPRAETPLHELEEERSYRGERTVACLAARTVGLLAAAGLRTVGDVATAGEAEVRRIPGVSRFNCRRLSQVLRAAGLAWQEARSDLQVLEALFERSVGGQ